MNLVLLGPPGAGKGTQAGRISKTYGLVHLSTGDILRAERKAATDLGIKAQGYMDRGMLVADDLILALMMEHINQMNANGGFLLDGFPRTLTQAKGLDERLADQEQKIDGVISIEIDDQEATKRLTGRSSCAKCGRIFHDVFSPPAETGLCDDCGEELSRRKDDDPDVVRKRLTTYHELTKPLIAYYRERGVLRSVSGRGGVDEVTANIKKACQERRKR